MRPFPSEDAPKKEKNPRATEKQGAKYRYVTKEEFEAFTGSYDGVLLTEKGFMGEPPVALYRDPTKGNRLVAKIVFNEAMEGHPVYIDKKNEYRIYE